MLGSFEVTDFIKATWLDIIYISKEQLLAMRI